MKDDRLISLNAAIDALDKVAEMFPYRIPGNAKTYRQYNEAWSDAIDAAENALEALPSPQQWIPCSERLPEDGRVVLWCNEHGSVFTTAITARFDNSWAVGKRHRSSRMVAWMPLPEPWKGEEK